MKEKSCSEIIFTLRKYPRYRSGAAFWMTTKQDCPFYSQLYLFGFVNSLVWPLCCSDASMTADHMIICPVLMDSLSITITAKLGNICLIYLYNLFPIYDCLYYVFVFLLCILVIICVYWRQKCVYLTCCTGNKRK